MKTGKIKDFLRFIEKELNPALSELENLDDASRKHIQKLMYTNLVDRFDWLVDCLLLDNCREDELVKDAFKNLDKPINEGGLLKLLLKGDKLQDALTNQLQDALRLSILRQRHSTKLAKLYRTFDVDDDVMKKPRVNPSNGDIIEKIKPQKAHKNPHSICGYADWLYSRRNSIVHGSGGSKFLDRDRDQIKKVFNTDLPETFRLSLASIKTASKFYEGVCQMLDKE